MWQSPLNQYSYKDFEEFSPHEGGGATVITTIQVDVSHQSTLCPSSLIECFWHFLPIHYKLYQVMDSGKSQESLGERDSMLLVTMHQVRLILAMGWLPVMLFLRSLVALSEKLGIWKWKQDRVNFAKLSKSFNLKRKHIVEELQS